MPQDGATIRACSLARPSSQPPSSPGPLPLRSKTAYGSRRRAKYLDCTISARHILSVGWSEQIKASLVDAALDVFRGYLPLRGTHPNSVVGEIKVKVALLDLVKD